MRADDYDELMRCVQSTGTLIERIIIVEITPYSLMPSGPSQQMEQATPPPPPKEKKVKTKANRKRSLQRRRQGRPKALSFRARRWLRRSVPGLIMSFV